MGILQTRKHIVVVDDSPVNLVFAETVLKGDYKVTKLISGEQLLKFLQRIRPDMILLDIQMPGLNGFETLTEVKKNPHWCDIPVIFITGQHDSASEQECFRLGAQDFIGKPFNKEVMLSRIRSQLELYEYRTKLEKLVQEKARRIEDLQHTITVGWAEMVESRDGTTGSHVRNTTRYFEILLELLSKAPAFSGAFLPESMKDLVRASTVHDIGKIGISDQVLKKPGPLTQEEYVSMQTHSRIGANMIQKIIDSTHVDDFLYYAKDMALYHHERWDGTGYPCGLKGEEIPVYVRVLSVADVYDALTSVRPYKKAFSHEQALSIMLDERGEFFSPDILDIFLKNESVIHLVLDSKND